MEQYINIDKYIKKEYNNEELFILEQIESEVINMNQKNNVQTNLIKMAFTGLMAALVCVSTAIFVVPLITGGYANLGDCFVALSGYMLGPVFGALAGGIGSCLADIFLGYTLYAPFTFAIKAIMAIIVYYISNLGKKRSFSVQLLFIALATFLAECFMVGGYFALEVFYYDFAGALANVFGNAMQGIFGCISASFVYVVMEKSNLFAHANKLIGAK